MKRSISVLLIALFAVLLLPIHAKAAVFDRVIDEVDILSESRLAELNEYAQEISDTYRIDVAFFLLSDEYASYSTLSEAVSDRYLMLGFGANGVAMAHDVDGDLWTIVRFGRAEEIFVDENRSRLAAAYNVESTYSGGLLAYLQTAEAILATAEAPTAVDVTPPAPVAEPTSPEPAPAPSTPLSTEYIIDLADLLTAAQLQTLESRAAALAANYPSEVRIVTVDDMEAYGYSDISDFAYGAYSDLDFGYGADSDCILLVLSMYERDYDLRVWGEYSKGVFTLYGIDNALDGYILPLLKNNDFFGAFSAFLDRAEVYFTMAQAGTPFAKRTDPVAIRRSFTLKLVATIVLPLLIAFFVCSVWKGQMKTAKLADTAISYIPAGGFHLTTQNDTYLYRTVTRTKAASSSSSGGASGGGKGGSSGRKGKF